MWSRWSRVRIPSATLSVRCGHGADTAAAGADVASRLAQYRFSAPCTFTTQTIQPTNGISTHRPVQPLTVAFSPSPAYMCPTSEGMTKALTIEIRIPITRPSTPPRPSPVRCFISSKVLYVQ